MEENAHRVDEPPAIRAERPSLPYAPALDGLRGVAVLAVVAFHAGFVWAGGGFLGVSTFFTLSGFLITTLLLSAPRPATWADRRLFWARRVRRLMPAATVTILMAAVFGAFVADAGQLARLRGDMLAALAYVANWRFMFSGESYADLFSGPSPLLHFWSLAIEEQFYLLYPLLFMGLLAVTRGRRGRLLAAIGVLAVLSSAWMVTLALTGNSVDRLYYGTDTRAGELLFGAALAVALHGRWTEHRLVSGRAIGFAGPVALVALAGLYWQADLGDSWLFRGGLTAAALLAVVVIVAALVPHGPLPRILSSPPLRGLGLISYPLYLFHWPIFLWLKQSYGWSTWRLFIVGGALAVALATLSTALLERPIRRRLVLIGPSRWYVVPAATVAVVAAAFLVTANPATDDPLTLLSAAEARGTAPAPVTAPQERPGIDRPVRLTILGDGPAGDVATELDGLGPATGIDASYVEADLAALGTDQIIEVMVTEPDVVLLMSSSFAVSDADVATAAAGLTNLRAGIVEQGATLAIAPFPRPVEATGAPAVTPATQRGLQILQDQALRDPATTLIAAADDLPPYPGPQADAAAVASWAAETAATLAPRLVEVGTDPGTLGAPPRIMVVGDSVSWFIGRGLELWALDQGGIHVWNTGTLGCGVARGGELQLSTGPSPSDVDCDDWARRWSEQVTEFDPDVVIMLTGLWDLADRALPTIDGVSSIGRQDFDEYLLGEYTEAVEVLGEGGAEVVWLTAPCYAAAILPGPLAETAALDPARQRYYNDVIVPRLAERAPITVMDLEARVCPDGFTQELGPAEGARPDGVHFTDDASYWIAEWLGPEVLELVDD